MRVRSLLLLPVLALLCATTTHAKAPVPFKSNAKSRRALSKLFPREMYDFLQCQVCHTPELSGSVQDSGCNYETVDKAVSEHFHPLLLELSRLTFFRYFKVDLGKECPFWQDDGMCSSIDCAVCECPQHEIPTKWYQMDTQQKMTNKARKQKRAKATNGAATQSDAPGKPCSAQTGESELSRVNRKNAVAGESFQEWTEEGSDEVWSDQDEAEDNMVYINLLENPERYTGYSGYQAERIWNAIYNENCFLPPAGQEKDVALPGMCFEERVYYRLISGLQASINTHIALRYKYGSTWGPNPSLFVHRVGKHRERLQNLYFTYLFVMRALGRYRNELLKYDFTTGNEQDDGRVVEILRQLVFEDKGYSTCPVEGQSVLAGFDEQSLFRVQQGQMSYEQFIDAKEQKQQLELQFREKFQNVSRIMDCVTCEKCRLWGKIQTMGIGTAIKILLVDDVANLPQLQRNELIALINVANNLSRSVDGVRMLRHLEFVEAIKQFGMICGGAFVGVVLFIVYMRKRSRKPENAEKKKTA